MTFYDPAPPAPPTIQEMIAHWRTRAESYRQIACRVFVETRTAYEKLADDCDGVADRLEGRPPELQPA